VTAMMAILVVVFGDRNVGGGSDNPDTLVNLGANYAPYVTRGDYWRCSR
jgi:rhomboid protease GluP